MRREHRIHLAKIRCYLTIANSPDEALDFIVFFNRITGWLFWTSLSKKTGEETVL